MQLWISCFFEMILIDVDDMLITLFAISCFTDNYSFYGYSLGHKDKINSART